MKKTVGWIISAIFLMVVCPWLTVEFAGGAGMAVCLLLFFALNPVFSAFCGVYAGKDIKRLWFLPIVTALLFLAGAWIFFEPGEMAFLLYGGCYLLIGVISMVVSSFMKNRKSGF